MGDGLKGVARLCGGLTATDGKTTVHYDRDGRQKPGGPTRDAIPIPAGWFFLIVEKGHYTEAGVDSAGSWIRLNDGQYVCPEYEEATP